MTTETGRGDPLFDGASLREQLAAIIAALPDDGLSLGSLLEIFGDEGLLLLTILLTLVFLIPVSIPGVSTVFGGAILLIGFSRLLGRTLWLPGKLRDRPLPAARLRPALGAGMKWVQRLEKVSRPHRLRGLVDGRVQDMVISLAFILAALLLMVPLGFVPFSNTLPALALLAYAIGLIQRDGGAVLIGHAFNIGTIVYFAALAGGGSVAIRELLERVSAG